MSLPRGRQPDLPLVTPGGGDDGARGIHVITPISCRSCAVIVAPSVGQYATGVRHLGNIKITPAVIKRSHPEKRASDVDQRSGTGGELCFIFVSSTSEGQHPPPIKRALYVIFCVTTLQQLSCEGGIGSVYVRFCWIFFFATNPNANCPCRTDEGT